MIGRNFPSPEVAERTLEQYSTSVLEHTLAPPPLPKPEFRDAMQATHGWFLEAATELCFIAKNTGLFDTCSMDVRCEYLTRRRAMHVSITLLYIYAHINTRCLKTWFHRTTV